MEIHRLDPSNRRDVRRWIEFPFRLYRDEPRWVPPFVHEARAQLDVGQHPFYQHSAAAFFVARASDEVVGRIAVLDHARYNAHHGTRSAWFYLFESVDDRSVSRALFDAACEWARGRGLNSIWGPKGLSHLDGQGVLVDGFEYRPAVGIPYNYSYYQRLLEDSGFRKKLDLISWFADGSFCLPDRFFEVADKVKARRGLRSIVFRSKAELRALVPRIVAIYNESFTEVQGFVPITEAEGRAIGERILAIADPSLISVLMREDELAGFVIAYPDPSAALQRCRGRIWPTGWYHLRREFGQTEWIDFNGAAILKQYRGLGGNALLYAEMYRTLAGHPQYRYADFVQSQETNGRMVGDLEAMGLTPCKRHRLFEQQL